MTAVLANSIVPIFVGLLLGYAAGICKAVDSRNVKSLVTFLMTFAMRWIYDRRDAPRAGRKIEFLTDRIPKLARFVFCILGWKRQA